MKKKDIDNKEINNNQKKKSNKTVLIVCIVVGILFFAFVYFMSFFVIFGALALDENLDNSTKYEVVNNEVTFEDGRAVIRDLSGSYNEDTKTYLITGYVNNKNASVLEIDIDYYDNNNYIIAKKTEYIDMHPDKNYKIKVVYDDFDSNEIYNFKVSRIYCE